MDKAIESIEREIKEKQEEIQKLQVAKLILQGKTPSEIVMEKYKVSGNDKPRRKIKGKRWSDIETRQLINLYHTLDIPYTKKITRIANILKMPRKRVANKVYHLKAEELIKEKIIRKRPLRLPKWTKWTPEKIETVINLTNQGKKPQEISEITGINHRAISNKMYELRKQRLVVKRKYNKWTPNKEKKLIELINEGYKRKEIVKELGMKEGSVKSKLFRLRKQGIISPIKKEKSKITDIFKW